MEREGPELSSVSGCTIGVFGGVLGGVLGGGGLGGGFRSRVALHVGHTAFHLAHSSIQRLWKM